MVFCYGSYNKLFLLKCLFSKLNIILEITFKGKALTNIRNNIRAKLVLSFLRLGKFAHGFLSAVQGSGPPFLVPALPLALGPRIPSCSGSKSLHSSVAPNHLQEDGCEEGEDYRAQGGQDYHRDRTDARVCRCGDCGQKK